MAENLGVHWEITSTGAEVYLKDADAARRDAEATEKLRAANGRLEKANASLRSHIDQAKAAQQAQARAAQDATAKAERYIRTQTLVTQIMRDTGASHTTAARAVRIFGTDLDRAEKEAAQYARQMDRAEQEVRQLTAAQKLAAGQTGLSAKLTAGLTGSIKSLGLQILAAVGLTALFSKGVRFLASEIVDAVSGFMELQDAVVGLRKVTDQLEEPQLQQLVSDLELLTSTTVPVAIADLTDLAATAGQIGIQSAEGIRLAAATGAQLAQATDIQGSQAITSLSRILAIQGEAISSIDNLGSALVALGNTSRATESEIEPIANEIARSTANYKLGSATIFGYAAALAEVGAKAEGSGTALADLFNTLLKAAGTGKGLEGLAQVAGVSADELKRLAKSDISAAALQFLEGLARFGEQGAIALGKVGLDSQRTGKALLPLAANVERLRDRIALSNKEFEGNSALSKEAAAAFSKLSADVQRVKNAYQLLTTDGVAVLAPVLSDLLQGVAAALVAWRSFSQELAKVPIVTALVKTALIVLTAQLKASLDFWTSLPRNIALTLVGLVDQIAEVYEALSRLPGGNALFRYGETAASLRNLEADLIALALAGPRAGAGLADAGDAGDDLASVLAKLQGDMDAAMAGLDGAGKAATNFFISLGDATKEALRTAKATDTLAGAQQHGARAVAEVASELEIERAVMAQVLQAQKLGVAGTKAFRDALARYEQAIREAAEAERRLAGKETLARLKDQIAVEQALLAITSAGPAAVDALAKSLDRERQILEATAKASKRQAAEIEASMRRLFALQDARAVASQVQAIRQEIEEARRLTAARAQGTAAAEAEAAQIQLENDLRAAAAGGMNLMTVALMGLIAARAQEAAQARQSNALQNLKDEIELLRLRNRVTLEGLRSGLSQSEAQRKGDLAAQVERMRKETGLARDVIAGFVDEQTRLNDEFERTVSMLEYSGAVLDRIAGIMSQMGGTVGEIGQALGGISQGFSAIQSGLAQGGLLGGLDVVSGAMALTAAANSIAGALGLMQGDRGTSIFGGQRSGDYAGAFGGLIGPIGGLIKRGADTFLATILDFGNGLVATIDKVEGGLGPAGNSLVDGIVDVFANLETAVGGAINVAGVQLKIRDDVVTVFVNGIKGAFEGETAIQDAIAFAVSEMLETADFGAGISDTMQAILRNGFESLDQLEAAVNFGNRLDDLLAAPLDRFFNAMNRSARELLATATQLGVPIQTVVAAMQAQAQAALDVSRAAVLAAAGLDPSIEAWKTLQDQINQVSEDAVAKLEDDLLALAQAALDSAAAAGTGAAAFDGSRESFEDFLAEMEISGERADQLRARFEDLARAGVPAAEIAQELALALQGLDSAQIRQAIDRFRSQFLGGLYDQMAQLARAAGNQKLAAEFAARAEDFRFVAMMISTRVTIAAAQAEGLISTARAAALNLQLDNLARLRRELAQSGGGRGGRGRGAAPSAEPELTTDADREAEEAARRAAEATRSFADTLALLESRAAGVTDTARTYADEQARLLALYRDGEVPLSDYVRALELMAQLHLEDIAADWTGAAQSIRQTDLQAATLALRDRAQQAWADALLAAADNPAAYAAAAQAIAEGLETEMHLLGREALGELGSEFVRLRREGMATVREIRYLANHLEEFGLTAGQLARVVREGILPGLLDMAIAEAERVGDTERAIQLREQQADIERRLQLLQLDLWRAQLAAAGALNAAAQELIDQLIIDLGRPSAGPPVTEPGPLVPRAGDTRSQAARAAAIAASRGNQQRPGEAGGAEGGTADSLADIARSLEFDLATPAQQAAIRFAELRDRIMDAVGTEEERQRTLLLAQEQYDRQRLEGVRDALDELRGAAAGATGGVQGFRAAENEFAAAVASGDEARIEQAIRNLTAAAGAFDSAASQRAALDLARREVEQAIGPFLAGAGGAPSSLPSFGALGPGPVGALPPAPIVITQTAAGGGDLAAKLGSIDQRLARLEQPLLRIDQATAGTRANTGELPEIRRYIERTGI